MAAFLHFSLYSEKLQSFRVKDNRKNETIKDEHNFLLASVTSVHAVSHSGFFSLYCFKPRAKEGPLDDLLTHKRSPEHRTEIAISPQVTCGGNRLMLVAGPCAVESEEQMQECGEALSKAPVQALRGGVFKPRTSPYSFQGMGEEGLQILVESGKQHGLPVIAEVMSAKQLEEPMTV